MRKETILSAVVPDKRSEAERRSGTHNPREFDEDSELPSSPHNCSLWLWLPAFAGTTAGNDAAALRYRISARIISAAFSPIMIVGALVLPPISVGMIEASTMRKASTPRTFSFGSTTAIASVPILQVPTG